MATAEFKEANLKLSYQVGMTPEGKALKRAKSYRNVKENATADQLASAALTFSGFSSHTLLDVEKSVQQDIIN
ncbi:DUF1659 domain-containing protein [Paenisporosarcina cavernae]|uniref:DUF1659 domain-containing protein n=1 Tax=Paenisporosarcina cavernae TaxID=2320858 RepID=A0A385YS98_9BACL|nr:DUF1659 domain-containing protein [Paenisporosarcina cavernae]AYC29496.1 DUF1659 domain-containing protein [Paenisporosarcina cavernae]